MHERVCHRMRTSTVLTPAKYEAAKYEAVLNVIKEHES